MHRSAPGLLLLLLLPVGACDDPASLLEPFTSETDARAAVSAMLSALSETQPEGQMRGGTVLRGAGDVGGQIVDATVPCEGGGEVAFAGEFEIRGVDDGVGEGFDPLDPGELPTEAELPSIGFTYSVTFENCTTGGVALDGTLDYALETSWDAEAASFDATWSYGGTIEVSGDLTGQCAFDFGGTGDLSAEDWAAAIPEGFSGDACGFDAASVLEEGV